MAKFLNLLFPEWGDAINNHFAFVFVYGILLSFLICLVIFLVQTIRRRRLIDGLTQKVLNYDRPPQPRIKQELKREFDRKREFAEAWQEFEDSLIKRERNENEEVMYKTDEASLFFSEERLLEQHLNLRFWNSVPALFVGLGILGTFVGLVWGLIPFSDIDFTQTVQIQSAIRELLSGVSTAFVTSVWGMLTSLLFNVLEKWRVGRVSRAIAELQRALDRLFTLTTQEEISFRQEDELSQQTAALKSFSTDLANDIKSAMAEGRQEILSELNKTVEAFSTTILEQLRPILEKLMEAIEELRQQKEESSTDAIGKLIEEFQKSLSTSTVTQMEELAKTVGEASQSLKDLPDQIGVMIASIQEQINETRQLLAETSQEQTDQMKSMMDEMIKTLQGVVELAANQTSEQLDQRMKDMKAVSAESIQTLQETIAELKQSITSISDQQQDAIGKITSQTAQASADATDRMSQFMDQITRRLSKTVQAAENSINKLLEQQKGQTEAFNVQITNSKDTLESGQKMLEEMGTSLASVRQIIDTTQNFSELLTIGADQLKGSGQQLIQASTVFNQENEKYLTANRETIQQLENLHGQSQQLLDNSTERFQTIDEGLQSIFAEIDRGMNNYSVTAREAINSYLNDFSTQLADASRALSSSVEALTDIVEEVSDMTERSSRR